MSEPTAVERTIAEAVIVTLKSRGRSPYMTGGRWFMELGVGNDNNDLAPLAQAVVAAIRNLPPEQMAQLIEGRVWRNSGAPPYIAPRERVVGPWREVTGSATPARDLTPGARDDL